MRLGHYDPVAKETTYKASIDSIEQMSRLSSLVSHKVNNQLAFLINYLFLIKRSLSKDPGWPDLIEMVESLEHSVRGIEQLLKGTSDALKGEKRGKVEHSIQNYHEITKIFSGEADTYCHNGQTAVMQWTKKCRLLCPELDSSLVVPIREVMNNAIEAGASKIKLCLTVQKKIAIITITDNGNGIEPHNLPKLFTPFFTTNISRQGLGLFLSGNILCRIGGTISIKNNLKSGSCVTISVDSCLINPQTV